MKIYLKRNSGETIELDVHPQISVYDFAVLAYHNRAAGQQSAVLDDYLKYIELFHSGHTFNLSKKLSDYNIKEHHTIVEIRKSITMQPGFDWARLAFDTKTIKFNEDSSTLNLECGHEYEEQKLFDWVCDRFAHDQSPTCPCCKATIAESSIQQLFLRCNQSATSSLSSAPVSAATSLYTSNSAAFTPRLSDFTASAAKPAITSINNISSDNTYYSISSAAAAAAPRYSSPTPAPVTPNKSHRYPSAATSTKNSRPYASAATPASDSRPSVSAATSANINRLYASAAVSADNSRPYASAASPASDSRSAVSAASPAGTTYLAATAASPAEVAAYMRSSRRK